jgi:hypothetical protein
MWGSKQDHQEDGEPGVTDDGAAPSTRSGRSGGQSRRGNEAREEPDERTSLLDRPRHPPNSDGYLDPDDPAVRFLINLNLVLTAHDTNIK